MGNKIHIGAPYTVAENDCVQLCVDTHWIVNEKDYPYTFFYKVEKEWGRFFVTEKSDAWVEAFLEVAMEHGLDIEFEKPISEDLKYQFERYLIPAYAQHFDVLHEIKLAGPFTPDAIPSENAAGTGFSGGVDSFYSVLSHLDTGMPGKDVTHLLLAVNGAAITGYTEEVDEDWYKAEMARFTPLADEMGLKLVGVRSNVQYLNQYKTILKGGDAIVTIAFVHALSKLFGTYYWASTYAADIMEFNSHDGGYMEPFVLPLLSIRGGVRVYHSGAETDRVGKVQFIADNPIVQKNLTVCGNVQNCGRCFKCLHTMAELYASGNLDKFSAVFPIEDFRKHLASRLAECFVVSLPPFTKYILDAMHRNGIRVPLGTYPMMWLWYKPLHYFKGKLRTNRKLRKIYYKYRIDKRLFGIETDERIKQAHLEGRGKG